VASWTTTSIPRMRRRDLIRRVVSLLGLSALASACGLFDAKPSTATATPVPGPITLAVRGATLLDSGADRVTILIAGSRIADVLHGDPSLSAGVRVIEADGLVAIPGLIDAHVHWRDWAAPLFLRYGVTTVRDVGSDPDAILRTRDRSKLDDWSGPRVIAHGPLLDGAPPIWVGWSGSVPLASAEEATTVTSDLLKRGLDGLKVYAQLPLNRLRAVMDVARASGAPVAAHLGLVAARDAVVAGVRSIEHASGVNYAGTSGDLEELAKMLANSGTFVVPTQLVMRNFATLPKIGTASYPGLELVSADTKAAWLDWRNDFRLRSVSDSDFAPFEAQFARRALFLDPFRGAGGRIVAGSDTPNPFVVPGLSLHQELDELVRLGLTPFDVIRSATSVAAEMIGRPDLGTIARGKAADVVLVAGDPRVDVAAARNVRLVLRGGAVAYQAAS